MLARNLAERNADGLRVSLDMLAFPESRDVAHIRIQVTDLVSGVLIASSLVPQDRALDAFNHPFAYVR